MRARPLSTLSGFPGFFRVVHSIAISLPNMADTVLYYLVYHRPRCLFNSRRDRVEIPAASLFGGLAPGGGRHDESGPQRSTNKEFGRVSGRASIAGPARLEEAMAWLIRDLKVDDRPGHGG